MLSGCGGKKEETPTSGGAGQSDTAASGTEKAEPKEGETAGTSAEGKTEPEVKEVILATTTSTMDTGLLDVLIPEFEKETGYVVKPIGVGTGQALEMGKRGEADVLLVHAPAAEKEMVESGYAINRKLVMHNDFIIVGPPGDPAGTKGKSASDALKAIAEKQALFVSRGDDSGTHKKEKDLWKAASIQPSGKWYQETGLGMGQTLNVASEKSGYTLTDRGTYLALKKNLSLEVLVEGDPRLLNIYHVMQVNPEKWPKVNAKGAEAFVDFMVSEKTQKIISEFGMAEYGSPLFFPDAGKSEEDLGA
ncbi:MAG TPA: solute-binding protein [Clostridia bacterium]|nr:solute-binding protein [Clostridia bacterium]